MTPRERASLAEQILANPLFATVMAEMEASAIERMIYADGHDAREQAALRVRAVREFRQACEESLRNTPGRVAPP